MTAVTMKAALLSLIVLGIGGCSREQTVTVHPRPTRLEVWEALQPRAARYRIEPTFIYALVAAESNFDPTARNGESRGLLQLRPAAWSAVSIQPYEPTVWDWRANLDAGIDYLAYCRSDLRRRAEVEFSYPLLLAVFHYGFEYVEARNFDVRRLQCPGNEIYRQLWNGDLAPLDPPR